MKQMDNTGKALKASYHGHQIISGVSKDLLEYEPEALL